MIQRLRNLASRVAGRITGRRRTASSRSGGRTSGS